MQIAQRINPVMRAILVIGAVAALVTSVTLAALQSQATLTDNSISSATAGLLVDGSDENTTPTASEAGFNFENLIPGAEYSAPETFMLSNTGSAPLSITVYSTPGTSSEVVDKNKVHVKITNTMGTEDTADDVSDEYTLAELETIFNPLPGVSTPDSLAAGETENFEIAVKIDESISGDGFTFDGFDLVFTGSAVAETPEETPETPEVPEEAPEEAPTETETVPAT